MSLFWLPLKRLLLLALASCGLGLACAVAEGESQSAPSCGEIGQSVSEQSAGERERAPRLLDSSQREPERDVERPRECAGDAKSRPAVVDASPLLRPERAVDPPRFDRLVRDNGSLIFEEGAGPIPWLWDAAPDLDPMRSLYLVSEEEANKRAALQFGPIGRDRVKDWELDDFGFEADADLFTVIRSASGFEPRLASNDVLRKRARGSGPAPSVGHFAVGNASGLGLPIAGGLASGVNASTAFAPPVAFPSTRFGGGASPQLGFGSAGALYTATASNVGRASASAGSVVTHFAGAPILSQSRHVSQNASARGDWSQPRATRPTDWASINWTRTPQKQWGPTVDLAAAGNYLISADRELSRIKLDGEGTGWNTAGVELGKVIDLEKYTLTVGGIFSLGEKRDVIRNGTVRARQRNLEVHVIGGGPGHGGLEISGVVTNGTMGATGLIKTGTGELILSSFIDPKRPDGPVSHDNTFTGAVYVNQGTLTLYKSGKSIAGREVYIGAGQGDAVLQIKSAGEQINREATLTLRGGEQGRAILRLERTQHDRGVGQTLRKLVIEGSGIVEFVNSHPGGGATNERTKSVLYLDELDIQGELSIRGWDKLNSQLVIKSHAQPDEVLLSRIHIEGYGKIRAAKNGGYWTITHEPGSEVPVAPEPATSGGLVSAGALSLALWRRWRLRLRRWRLRDLPKYG